MQAVYRQLSWLPVSVANIFQCASLFASSTQALVSWPGYWSSFFSRRSSKDIASAVPPANPTSISDLLETTRRTFFALGLAIVGPIDTWPSPTIANFPSFRMLQIVVAREVSYHDPLRLAIRNDYDCVQ